MKTKLAEVMAQLEKTTNPLLREYLAGVVAGLTYKLIKEKENDGRFESPKRQDGTN